jgi:DNA-binding XRE family transcriptional regulator
MPPRTRVAPNRLDPLSEPTPGRRLWAASLKAGYEVRTDFARAIGIRHHTLSLVESDRGFLSLANFATACQLVGYTMEEIYFGRNPRRREPALTLDAIVALCEDLDAAPAERAAFKRFLDSPEGALQRVTRAYLTTFVETHKTARELNHHSPEALLRQAVVAADNARAVSDALAAGVKSPSNRYRNGGGAGAAKKRS